MVLTYIKKGNKKRSYGYCNKENMELAIQEIPNKTLSIKKAAKKYDLKKSTLYDHLKKNMKSVGVPRALSYMIKKRLAKMIDDLAEWGYPVGKLEIKLMVKDILNNNKIIEKRFKNNLPGDDWVNGFVKRNKLSKRAASNIKRSRAAVNEELTNSFFDDLEKVFEEIDEHFKFFMFTWKVTKITYKVK